MKKFFALLTIFGGLSLVAADPYFESTMRHVDTGGEMLSYVNLTVPVRMGNGILAKAAKILAGESPESAGAIKILMNLFDLPSVKAYAASSIEKEPDFFVYKSFIRIDSSSKSVLLKCATNGEIDFLKLPADTRLALQLNINASAYWTRFNEEVAASGNQQLISNLANLKAMMQSEGIDIDRLAASLNGPVFLLVTGNSIQELKIMVRIPDANGSIAAQLRKQFPPQNGNVFLFPMLPIPGAKDPQIIYGDGVITFVSNAALLEAPAETLASRPQFAKYAEVLPREGSSLLLVDISKQFRDGIAPTLPAEAQPFVKRLTPISFVDVGFINEDGFGGVIASNFSVPMSLFTAIEKLADAAFDMLAAQRGGAPRRGGMERR